MIICNKVEQATIEQHQSVICLPFTHQTHPKCL